MPITAERGIHFENKYTTPFRPLPEVPERPVDPDTTRSLLKRQTREKLGSDAFNLEYDSLPTRAELKRDIVSYLGEYRLQVQKFDYELSYSRDRNHRGEVTLRDKDKGESMQIKAKRTLESRGLEKKPTHREEAELAGLQSLNDQLRTSQEGDTVIWASPPGPKEQGYGEYGFLFVGKVKEAGNGEKNVKMTAIRVEKPKQTNDIDPWIFRFGNVVNAATGREDTYGTPEDFLAKPRVIHEDIAARTIDTLLQQSFQFTPDAEAREKMEAIIKRMDPLIEQFIDKMDTGSKSERLKAFYALENYALKLRELGQDNAGETVIYRSTELHHDDLDQLTIQFGHRPPPVPGSCGNTEGRSSGLSFLSGGDAVKNATGGSSESDQYGPLTFTCTEGHQNTRPRGQLITKCQHDGCRGTVGC